MMAVPDIRRINDRLFVFPYFDFNVPWDERQHYLCLISLANGTFKFADLIPIQEQLDEEFKMINVEIIQNDDEKFIFQVDFAVDFNGTMSINKV